MLRHPPLLKGNIFDQKIYILFQYLYAVILVESFVIFTYVCALWGSISQAALVVWFWYMVIFSLSCKIIVLMLYRKNAKMYPNVLWITLLGACTFLCGVGWGTASSVLMPVGDIASQGFVLMLIIGIATVSNLVFCSVPIIYFLYLFPGFIPFIIWLFYNDSVFYSLWPSAILYMGFMIYIAFKSHNLISTALLSHYKHLNHEKFIKTTLESLNDGILVVDTNGHVLYYNEPFLRMWNIPESLINNGNGNNIQKCVLDQLINPDTFVKKLDYIYAHPEQEGYDEIDFKDGRIFERCTKPQILNKTIVGRIWEFRDITSRNKLAHQATHDPLTNLPNRLALNNYLHNSIHYASSIYCNIALLFLDIDNFKNINDSFAHEAGDNLLVQLAGRLKDCVRDTDMVARLGGDEFVIVIMTSQLDDAKFLAVKILQEISRPISLQKNHIEITTSIGISLYPNDGEEPSKLIKHADLAMYHAKQEGRNNFQYFHKDLLNKEIASFEKRKSLQKK